MQTAKYVENSNKNISYLNNLTLETTTENDKLIDKCKNLKQEKDD